MTANALRLCSIALCVSAIACSDDSDDGAQATDAALSDAATPDAARIDATPPDAASPDAAAATDAGTDTGTNTGFVTPDETVTAYELVGSDWVLVGPANYDCLDTPSPDSPTSVAVTLSGTVEDLQTGGTISDAALAVYAYPDFGAPVATATADGDGDYSVEIPAGTGPLAVEVQRTGFHDTLRLPTALAADAPTQTLDLQIASELTLNALPAFVGVMRTPGLGISWSTAFDCDGNRVAGAIATVSNSPGTPAHRGDATTFYFSAGSTSLPVRHTQQRTTNDDGLFMTLEVAPADATYIQAWGFVTPADKTAGTLRLLCEVEAPIRPDGLTNAECRPKRAD